MLKDICLFLTTENYDYLLSQEKSLKEELETLQKKLISNINIYSTSNPLESMTDVVNNKKLEVKLKNELKELQERISKMKNSNEFNQS